MVFYEVRVVYETGDKLLGIDGDAVDSLSILYSHLEGLLGTDC